MSDVGNYCADCRFLHRAGVGRGWRGGSAAPPKSAQQQGQSKEGGGGGNTVNIGVIACILEYIQPCCEASCADTSTNLQPNFGQRKYQFMYSESRNCWKVLRIICCGIEKTSCFFAFFGCEKTVTLHHGHCVSLSAIESCARACSHVTLLHPAQKRWAPSDFPDINRCL